jgi:hypothetical protein
MSFLDIMVGCYAALVLHDFVEMLVNSFKKRY